MLHERVAVTTRSVHKAANWDTDSALISSWSSLPDVVAAPVEDHAVSAAGEGNRQLGSSLDMSGRYADAYANFKGPGDARPTALQVVHDEKLEGKLPGKVFLVTGGFSSSGAPGLGTLHLFSQDLQRHCQHADAKRCPQAQRQCVLC